MPKPVVLTVNKLTVDRGPTRILQQISWQVRQNEHWTILGPNGSGKTALLSALTGYLTPSSGEITLLSARYGATDWRVLRAQIGFVSSSIRQMIPDDEPALTTVASGKGAVIGYWGNVAPNERAAATRILRAVEGSHLAKRPWGVLSQGERQRVLIGRALIAAPRLLILDEPCAGLDPVAREHFLTFVQRLGTKRRRPSLLLVTHHVEEIMPLFSHALLLREGHVIAHGALDDVLTSATLSRAFGTKVRLLKQANRYALRVLTRRPRNII